MGKIGRATYEKGVAMAKKEVDRNLIFPMPVALVGANVDGRPNFMAAGWFTRVNMDPPLVAVALSVDHFTARGIEQNESFSICLPSRHQIAETDYCGLVSGKEVDKSRIFTVEYGKLQTAPMAAECPVCVECRLVRTVELQGDNVYIGEIVAAYLDERCEGTMDAKALELVFLTMPDNAYWVLGEKVADAWSVGENLSSKGGEA